jgi:hypothetical protein
MNLSVPHIEIVQPKPKSLADPHACAQEQKDQGSIPDIVNHREKLFYIGGIHGPGQDLGKLELNRPLQNALGDDFLFNQEVQKGNQAGLFRPDRGDLKPGILDVFNEGLKIGPLDLFQVFLTRLSVQLEKKLDRCKRTLEGAMLVVQAPFVAQVALEVLFGGELKSGELLQELLNRGLGKILLMLDRTFTFDGFITGRFYLDHVSSFFFSQEKAGRS